MGQRLHQVPSLPWIKVAQGAPYFITDGGEDWTPIGQNDAITWPDLVGAYRGRDLATVEAYLGRLQAAGVTVLRLMSEYCHTDECYLEQPIGVFQPAMVELWDHLFARCASYGLRILFTPFDTFWMWMRWSDHPYHQAHGGPCLERNQWLLSREMRTAIKRRYQFMIERWSGSGVIFGWDLWNELHPAHAADSTEPFAEFIADLSEFVRTVELQRFGRAHLQTVSFFGPVVLEHPQIAGLVYRHPALDFFSTHFYERDTIDCPRNTVDPAISTGCLMREALAQSTEGRPFLDSEHGPIHLFKDRQVTLSEGFDDEYFRHMQWAHFASGGAGGGMRWPNRHPHSLTSGMRAAQAGLARFLPHIAWQRFRRRNLNAELTCPLDEVTLFGCGDKEQAIVWLLRRDRIGDDGRLRTDAEPLRTTVIVPGLTVGGYIVTAWDTVRGAPVSQIRMVHTNDALCIPLPPFVGDIAVAVQRQP